MYKRSSSPSITDSKIRFYWAKIQARAIVAREIKSGRLKREDCSECGQPNAQAHHPNYLYPLKVVWLCQIHHLELHNSLEPKEATVTYGA